MAEITEDWLREIGFKWHQFDRQPAKHWLLWLGDAIASKTTGYEDLGIELAPAWWQNRHGDDMGDVGGWNCWLRADSAGRYHRFIHVRHLHRQSDLIALVEALTGQAWNPENNFGGSMLRPSRAAAIRAELDRPDRVLLRARHPWAECEKDDSRGRALPEHLEAYVKANPKTQ